MLTILVTVAAKNKDLVSGTLVTQLSEAVSACVMSPSEGVEM